MEKHVCLGLPDSVFWTVLVFEKRFVFVFFWGGLLRFLPWVFVSSPFQPNLSNLWLSKSGPPETSRMGSPTKQAQQPFKFCKGWAELAS